MLFSWKIGCDFYQNTELVDHVINNSDDPTTCSLIFKEAIKKGHDMTVLYIIKAKQIIVTNKDLLFFVNQLLINSKTMKNSSSNKIYRYLIELDKENICDVDFYRKMLKNIAIILYHKKLINANSIFNILLDHISKKQNVAELFINDFHCNFIGIESLLSPKQNLNSMYFYELISSYTYRENYQDIIKKCIDLSIPNISEPKYLKFGIEVIKNIYYSEHELMQYIIDRLWNIDEENYFFLLEKIISSNYYYDNKTNIFRSLLELDGINTNCNVKKYRKNVWL